MSRARRGVLGVVLAGLVLGMLPVFAAQSGATALEATGGTGRFKTAIQWFSWGDPAELFQPGSTVTRTETTQLGDQELATTCTISNITGDTLHPYRSGTWRGDGFDNLYNINGTDANNQLVVGLANVTNGGRTQFDFSCSATLDGQPFDLTGLVMADAESSSVNEYVGATPVAASADQPVTWRIIDRVRGANCTVEPTGWRDPVTNRLELYGAPQDTCEAAGRSDLWPAPAAVAFMEGATSATNVVVNGRGWSAIALGVAIQFDSGDAPESYGSATAALQYKFQGGEVPASTGLPPSQGGTDRGTPLYAGFNLATVGQPDQRLGNTVDPDFTIDQTSDATGDDLSGDPLFGGPDDEDAVNLRDADGSPTQFIVTEGEPFTLPIDIPFHGTGKVAAWIDFNGDGIFDANEGSEPITASGGRLTWTSPPALTSNVLTTFMRLRMVGPTELLTPTGVSLAGEVEDHQLRLAKPSRLTVVKEVDGRVVPGDQFTISADGEALAEPLTVTTSGTDTSATLPPTWIQSNTAFSIKDAMAPGSGSVLDDYTVSIVCVDVANGDAPFELTGANGSWTSSGLAHGMDVECTITNAGKPRAVNITKVYEGTEGPSADGAFVVNYRVTVDNAGPADAYGELIDAPDFDPQLEILDATWTVAASSGTAPVGGSATGAGPYTLAPADTPIDRVSTHTFDLALTVRHRGDVEAADCTGPGTGMYNAASVPAEDGPTTDNSACAPPPPLPPLSLVLEKAIDGDPEDVNGNGHTDAGDVVNYVFTVTNTSPVTLDELEVVDPLVGAVSCAVTTLAPGASTTCTGSYVISQGEVDKGSVDNIAHATATGPTGGTVRSNDDEANLPIEALPGIEVEKTVSGVEDVNASGLTDAGDRITYGFTVTNTGNVTLDPVTVDDPLLGAGAVTCEATSLAPGVSTTCSAAPYVVTVDDEVAGAVNNTATAAGTPPAGPDGPREPVTDEDSTSTPTTVPAPALVLEKTVSGVEDANSSGLTDAGDLITYGFTVTNTGNVPLAPVTVDDPLLGAGAVTCEATSLAPGASTTCSAAPYVVTVDDEVAGAVNNTATAAGTPPAGPDGPREPVTDEDSTSTPTTIPAPALVLEKTVSSVEDANSSGLTDAGDLVTYGFTVTNTGNVPVAGVAVIDPMLTDAGLTISCTPTTLGIGEIATCRTDAPYVLTERDQLAGQVTNTAHATGVDPDGGSVASPEDSAVVETSGAPDPVAGISLVKNATLRDVDGDGRADEGEEILYTFTVTNTGTLALTDVRVHDAMLEKAGDVITCKATQLAPGESTACTAVYRVAETDVRAGTDILNVATASGKTPGGDTVTSKEARASVPVANGLANTGTTVPYGPLLIAMMLLAAGILTARRSRSV